MRPLPPQRRVAGACCSLLWEEEGAPEFSPTPGLEPLPSTSCVQALCLLTDMPRWDKHVSNQLYDVAAPRPPWLSGWSTLVPPARDTCQIPGSSIPASDACPNGDPGSAAKGLSGINGSAPTESSQTQNVFLEGPRCIHSRFASAQAATGRG